MSADFIYTLDSEPVSDVDQDDEAHAKSSKAAAETASLDPHNVSSNNAIPVSKGKNKLRTKKSPARSKDEDEDEAAPTIDPSFNFDLGGGADGTTFFDGLGDSDGVGEADEVRTGTKPVRLNIFACFINAPIVILESNLILIDSLINSVGTYLSRRYH
jgi:hypothetical protein